MRRGGFNVYQAEDLIFCNDNRRSRNGKKSCHCGNNGGGNNCGHEDVDDIHDTLEELRDLIEDLTDEVREKDKRIRRLAKRVEKLEKNSQTPP